MQILLPAASAQELAFKLSRPAMASQPTTLHLLTGTAAVIALVFALLRACKSLSAWNAIARACWCDSCIRVVQSVKRRRMRSLYRQSLQPSDQMQASW